MDRTQKRWVQFLLLIGWCKNPVGESVCRKLLLQFSTYLNETCYTWHCEAPHKGPELCKLLIYIYIENSIVFKSFFDGLLNFILNSNFFYNFFL